MKKILLFGAGKSATSLISYLIEQTRTHDWQLIVADGNLPLARSKIGTDDTERVKAMALQVEDEQAREALVRRADIVISLLPPALHFLVAGSCVTWKKDLLTASYLDDNIKALEPAILQKGLLFLCEMGLDPGIDHMSAMQLIHSIREKNGKIISFRSHTGGLIAPESDDNPWHYKISWNPRNIVMAGSAGAQYKEKNKLISRQYGELFEDCGQVNPDGIGLLAWYPNRDSLSYIPIYGLEEAATFIRTTLRYPIFCRAWNAIVKAGLTDDRQPLVEPSFMRQPDAAGPDGFTFAAWSAPIRPFIDPENKTLLEFLGLFDERVVPPTARSSADVLQYLLETKLAMHSKDKDMIVMYHELEYEIPHPIATVKHSVSSCLIVKGEDHLHTAMAKTVGLPLGIAARLILEGDIRLKGLHIPILPEVYTPVLKELERQGIRFKETFG
jgi:saccharopine dehydrogenase-like NADP-dependent oxidoreductase